MEPLDELAAARPRAATPNEATTAAARAGLVSYVDEALQEGGVPVGPVPLGREVVAGHRRALALCAAAAAVVVVVALGARLQGSDETASGPDRAPADRPTDRPPDSTTGTTADGPDGVTSTTTTTTILPPVSSGSGVRPSGVSLPGPVPPGTAATNASTTTSTTIPTTTTSSTSTTTTSTTSTSSTTTSLP